MKMEVCVDNIRSVKNAFKGGADRIELCSALSEGGLTPTVGFLHATRSATTSSFPIFTMIRPRGGNFVYDETEVEIMIDDIKALKSGGADGFVFGLLNTDGTVDVENCRRLIREARPLPVTFHRAFDEMTSPDVGLDTIIELGFDRLLTSGQAMTAELGKDVISRLIAQSNGRLIIMPGGGVTADNLENILLSTRATEFHGSAKGPVVDDGYSSIVTSESVVRNMKLIASKI